jgi:amidophosphoribosyltransferase
MGGFFGVVSNKESSRTLYYGTDYHSHLGTRRGGMAITGEDGRIMAIIHDIASTQFRAKFESHMDKLKGQCGIGVISDYDDQPLTIYSRLGTYSIVTVGKINNLEALVEDSFNNHHSGHYLAMSGGIINPTELIATLINQKTTFEEGIEYAYSKIKGSMSILIMCDGVLYAARDRYGRTPVFIGQSHDTTAVSMEDAAFLNLGLKMVLELGPGQIVKLTPETITELKPAREEMQICAFLWVYYGYPSSTYEGKNAEVFRCNSGAILQQNKSIPPVDLICGVPDSGVGYAIGLSNASGCNYGRALVKYSPTWARSFMPPEQSLRDLVSKMKLIPVEELIKDHRLLFCDDSIVRGTQLRNIIYRLMTIGAKEVHMRIASPPLLYGCPYLNFSRSKNDFDLITRRVIAELEPENPSPDIESYQDPNSEKNKKMVEMICKIIGATSLEYQTIEGLLKAIDLPPEKICTYCFTGCDRYNQK